MIKFESVVYKITFDIEDESELDLVNYFVRKKLGKDRFFNIGDTLNISIMDSDSQFDDVKNFHDKYYLRKELKNNLNNNNLYKKGVKI